MTTAAVFISRGEAGTSWPELRVTLNHQLYRRTVVPYNGHRGYHNQMVVRIRTTR